MGELTPISNLAIIKKQYWLSKQISFSKSLRKIKPVDSVEGNLPKSFPQ